VGKTSLIFRFLNNLCPIEHLATIEEEYSMKFKTENGEERDFKIIDIAGEETNQNLMDEWICNSQGFILVFAINEENSFENIKFYIEKIKKNKSSDKYPIILVGNKCDLENERKVTKQNAENYAKSISASYYECSALKNENGNCQLIFQECANKIIKIMNDEDKKDSKCTKCSIF